MRPILHAMSRAPSLVIVTPGAVALRPPARCPAPTALNTSPRARHTTDTVCRDRRVYRCVGGDKARLSRRAALRPLHRDKTRLEGSQHHRLTDTEHRIRVQQMIPAHRRPACVVIVRRDPRPGPTTAYIAPDLHAARHRFKQLRMHLPVPGRAHDPVRAGAIRGASAGPYAAFAQSVPAKAHLIRGRCARHADPDTVRWRQRPARPPLRHCSGCCPQGVRLDKSRTV
jgi:hypothetical protein